MLSKYGDLNDLYEKQAPSYITDDFTILDRVFEIMSGLIEYINLINTFENSTSNTLILQNKLRRTVANGCSKTIRNSQISIEKMIDTLKHKNYKNTN